MSMEVNNTAVYIIMHDRYEAILGTQSKKHDGLLFTATAAMHRILAWHASYLHVRGTDTTRYRTGTRYLYPRDGYMYPNICTRVLAVNLEYQI